MNCHEAQKLINDYLEGSLDGVTTEAFLAHVQHCPKCARVMQECGIARDVLKQTAGNDLRVPDTLSDRIKAAVRQAEEHDRILATSRRPAIGSPAFIATCASLLIGAIMIYILTTQVYMKRLNATGAARYHQPTEVWDYTATERPQAQAGQDGSTEEATAPPSQNAPPATASAPRQSSPATALPRQPEDDAVSDSDPAPTGDPPEPSD